MDNLRNKAGKIDSFTKLIAWQQAHRLVLMIYKITRLFPKDELFGLTSQMRRAAISITSNIAEGFNRRTANDKIHFYYIALGSLTEEQNQLLASRDIGYVNNESFKELADQSVFVSKLINGLIKATKGPALS